jgi:hypothetical protein
VWLAIVGLAVAPGLYLAWQLALAWTGQPHALGEEPVERLEHETGQLAIRMLAATLAISPLRWLGTRPAAARWPRASAVLRAVMPYRRTFGLLTFWYASAHLATYAVLDLELQLAEVAAEIVKRPVPARRLRGVARPRAAGPDEHHRLDPPARRAAVERAPPAHLRGRGARPRALLVEPEEGRQRAAALDARLRRAARLARVAPARAAGRGDLERRRAYDAARTRRRDAAA